MENDSLRSKSKIDRTNLFLGGLSVAFVGLAAALVKK